MSISSTLERPDLRKIGISPNFWYPLAQSKKIKKGKAYGVKFSGEPIVLVKTESNKVFALEDRCAHRQVSLSKGVVCGEQIKCGYHAWQYNDLGKITKIPYSAQGVELSRCRVKSYPCKEAYGHIWVFPGDSELAEKTAFPKLDVWNSLEYKTLFFFRKVNCHYSFHFENLMDMNHQFLHRKLMSNNQPNFLESSHGSDWVEVNYKFSQNTGKSLSKFLTMGRNKELKDSDYDVMTIRTEYPYQILKICKESSDVPILNNWVTYMPIDREQKTHNVVGMLSIRKPKIPGLINLLLPLIRYFTEAVFVEDKMAIEMEQRAYELQGSDWNQEVFPTILNVRKLLINKGVLLSKI